MSYLLKLIKNYTLPNIYNCTVAIIGLGYVGLPLAIAISKNKTCKKSHKKLKRDLIGFDISVKRIEELTSGIDKTRETSKSELENAEIVFTTNKSKLKLADVFIVTVPTPINNKKNPDLNPLINASTTIAEIINSREKNSKPIVIYESTVFPGATEELCVPILERISGLKLNKGFFCGFSPERINPGDKEHTLDSIIKVTSGSNREAAKWIDKFYSSFISAGTFAASSIKIAEAAKIIENTQRDLNIALINELAILFKRMNIDTIDVLEAAQTKWNFLPFKPGLVGGHCIGVDPYYLTYKAEELGYSPEVILSGRRINDNMGKWIVEQLVKEMVKKGLIIAKSKALILGHAFKENCTDLRNTKVEDIFKSLTEYNIDTYISDPFVDIDEANKKFDNRVTKKIPKNICYDAIILAVGHDKYKFLSTKEWKALIKENGVIFDLKSILPRELGAYRL